MEDVVVIGTTNRIDAIDPALRRPGRFDREIRIGPPDAVGPARDLGHPHARRAAVRGSERFLAQVAAATHGYTGADLVDLIRDAGLRALRRRVGPGLERLEDPERGVPDIEVEREDLTEALEHTRPSALREAVVTAPETRWSDIGGLEEPIRILRETIEFPLLHPEAFTEMRPVPSSRRRAARAAGHGKTLLATAIARASGANLVTVQRARDLQQVAGRVRGARPGRIPDGPAVGSDRRPPRSARRDGARYERPDSSNPASERVVNQLLIELDGLAGRRTSSSWPRRTA